MFGYKEMLAMEREAETLLPASEQISFRFLPVYEKEKLISRVIGQLAYRNPLNIYCYNFDPEAETLERAVTKFREHLAPC